MLQILIQGLLLSGLYALIAVGFTMIFSVGRVLNLAYGAYIMLGGYVYHYFSHLLGLPKFVGMLAAILAGCLFGCLKYKCLVKPLKGDQVAVEIATLILAVVVQAGIVLVFNDSPKVLQPIVAGVWHIGSAAVTYNIVAATLASWVILAGLYLFVRKTQTGRAMSAVSMDVKGAAISGIQPDRINLITWGISGGLGAIAGGIFRQLHAALACHVGCPADHRGCRRHSRRDRFDHRHPGSGSHYRFHGNNFDIPDCRGITRGVYDAADNCRARHYAQGPVWS